MEINTIIGLDLAKTVFQIARTVDGKRCSERLRRDKVEGYFRALPPSIVAMEACGSAHYWGRVLKGMGHTVLLVPAAYVKPFVKRNKTDARDAQAIRVAAAQEGMRFVPVKSEAQQAARALHRVRDLAVEARTRYGNAMRGLLAEVGVIAAQGDAGLASLLALSEKGEDARVSPELMCLLQDLALMWRQADERVEDLDQRIRAQAIGDERARLLMTIPTVGPLTAHAIVAAVDDGKRFSSARDFAAWIGLTPVVKASAHRVRVGAISKAGDPGLRRLLTLGASSRMRHMRAKPEKQTAWVGGILARRPVKVAVVAQAAKTARIAWAVLTSGKPYQEGHRPAHKGRHHVVAEVAAA
jgi:transposase